MNERNGGRGIQSDEVLLDIIDYLEEKEKKGVSEIATAVDRSKGTVHAHLSSLANRGYVVNENGRYKLGLRFFSLGTDVRDTIDLYHAATPKIAEMATVAEENARCVVEENGLATFIAGATGKHSVSTDAGVGTRSPLHCISGGKAILAHLPEHRVRMIVERHGLPQRTENTITDFDILQEELEKSREQGFAINEGESITGVHAIGAPVLGKNDRPVGAVSVSGAAHRLTVERCRFEIADLLIATANEIELELEYS